jgi:hypothetical protein
VLVLLLFRDFVDCSPHALQPRVLLHPRAPIRFSKLVQPATFACPQLPT